MGSGRAAALGATFSARGSRARALGRGLFAAAVLLLIALGVWWMVLLDRSLQREHQLLRQSLADAAAVHAAHIALSGVRPALGAFEADGRFLFKRGAPSGLELGARVDGEFALVAGPTALARLRDHYDRKRVMLIGEGVLLCTLLLVVVAMLYQLFRAERRFHDEIEGFLSRVTHDMKTPLAGIKAVLQTIEAGRMPSDRLQELAGRALREVDREEAMIQNLLLAQRLRIGARLAREAVDLSALVAAALTQRQELPGPPTWRLERDEAVSTWIVQGDATALHSILDNLLDNAAKYGAKAVVVRLYAAPARGGKAGQGVAIEVEDDGIGFEPRRAARLFEPFAREADGLGRKGTGLGLWIARGLAEAMGGTVEAHSEGPGRGARFSLRL